MNKGKRPLVEALALFTEQQPISFHVPGHKHGQLSTLPAPFREALTYDVTELEGLDDLHAPAGVIQEAERLLAQLYGAEESFFLVNGSTVGNLAMLYATCSAGDTVIVQRNAHKSIFHAIELVGVRPIFVAPEWDEETKSTAGVALATIELALQQAPEAKAVLLTNPTYYGVVNKELPRIIEVCHQASIPVLVDEAHGAHFGIESFPVSALTMGADLVVQSAHKTLPAMTMGSFLHIRSSRVSKDRLRHYLHMLQSSSPSYVLMASLDDARAYVETYTYEDATFFKEQRQQWIHRLQTYRGIQVITTDDPLKILLRRHNCTGFLFQQQLEAEGVYVELADPYQVLIVLPLMKKGVDFPFNEAVVRVGKALAHKEEIAPPLMAWSYPSTQLSTQQYSFNNIRKMKTKWIDVESAVGHVIADSIIPYPPGIPLLIGGERMEATHLEWLQTLRDAGAKFQGGIHSEKGKIVVVDEGE